MPHRLRPESRNLKIVLQDTKRLAQLIRRRLEELSLKFEARSPGQIAADVQPLALDVQKHVVSENAFRRIRVMRTARGVNVMIAAVIAVIRRIEPALQLDVQVHRPRSVAMNLPRDELVFGSATVRHDEVPRRQ